MVAKEVKLADLPGAIEIATTDEQRERWQKGWAKLRKRAKEEGFADSQVRLLLLDRPIPFREVPLSKKHSTPPGHLSEFQTRFPRDPTCVSTSFLEQLDDNRHPQDWQTETAQ